MENKITKLPPLPEMLRFADGREVTAENLAERREEILEIFKTYEYGHFPTGDFTVTSEVLKRETDRIYGGKAAQNEVRLTISDGENSFAFDIVEVIPHSEKKLPAVVFLNFRPGIPDKAWPTEEIVDRGYAVFRVVYTDITPDKKDDRSGVMEAFGRNCDWGKISAWAWTASRILDYVLTLDTIDADNVAIAGGSRLGKTTLWCAANDTRFKYAFVHVAGCSGDTITRQKEGEQLADIYRVFPHWFCENYGKYAGCEDTMPFEQHWLAAAVAPRYIISGGAVEDVWADPMSQYLFCIAASPVYELMGMKGFVHPDRMPIPGDTFFEGRHGYFLRSGSHAFSRYDWNRYLDFVDAKRLV